jgi:hypothetical protein
MSRSKNDALYSRDVTTHGDLDLLVIKKRALNVYDNNMKQEAYILADA